LVPLLVIESLFLHYKDGSRYLAEARKKRRKKENTFTHHIEISVPRPVPVATIIINGTTNRPENDRFRRVWSDRQILQTIESQKAKLLEWGMSCKTRTLGVSGSQP